MREKIEHYQIVIYMIVIILAVIIGLMNSSTVTLNQFLPITLGILMYGMFLQIPFLQIKSSFAQYRFMSALLVGNYIFVPIIVALLIQFLPDQPAILFGVLLVLLTPCIDYVIVFTQIGKGDAKLMLASTPLLFISQLLLLPLYILMFIGKDFLSTFSIMPLIESFFSLIVLPLIAAITIQALMNKSRAIHSMANLSNWIPVPFMAIVLFIIIASQIKIILSAWQIIAYIIPIYMVFILIMPFIGLLIGKIFRLNGSTKRTLIYSISTRNSLAVLPFALALPNDMATIASSVIVTQTIIELLGELILTQVTPKIQ